MLLQLLTRGIAGGMFIIQCALDEHIFQIDGKRQLDEQSAGAPGAMP